MFIQIGATGRNAAGRAGKVYPGWLRAGGECALGHGAAFGALDKKVARWPAARTGVQGAGAGRAAMPGMSSKAR